MALRGEIRPSGAVRLRIEDAHRKTFRTTYGNATGRPRPAVASRDGARQGFETRERQCIEAHLGLRGQRTEATPGLESQQGDGFLLSALLESLLAAHSHYRPPDSCPATSRDAMA
jgi:hypothetical protein